MQNYQCRGKSYQPSRRRAHCVIVAFICTLRDCRIYLHATDQSQCIKQLQCIIIVYYQLFLVDMKRLEGKHLKPQFLHFQVGLRSLCALTLSSTRSLWAQVLFHDDSKLL